MSGLPFFNCYPSDFLAGIAGMEADEIAVYTVALMLMYDRGRPVEDDEARFAWQCHLTKRRARTVIDTLVAKGKLVREGAVLTNPRAEREIEKRKKSAEISRENGKRRAPKQDDADNDIKDLAKPPGTRQEPEPEARNQKPKENSASMRDRAWFDALETRLREAANVANNPAPGLLSIAPIVKLIDDGLDLERQIVPALRDAAKRGKRGNSWAFYIPIIQDAVTRAPAIKLAAAPASTVDMTEDQWRRATAFWKKSGGQWSYHAISDPPDSPTTKVPAAILAELNIHPAQAA